jgi:hypothetical protein
MNFDDLDHQTFELLIGLLLVREAYTVNRTPAHDVPLGPDFEAVGPNGVPVLVEVKHYRRSPRTPTMVVEQVVHEIGRVREQHPNAEAILATSGNLNEPAMARAAAAHITVWDGARVAEIIARHPDVVPIVKSVQESRGQLKNMLEDLKAPTKPQQSRWERVTGELSAVPPGRATWRDFEVLGTRILCDVFSPQLGAPETQERSDDGLDIVDAIFPVRGTAPPWAIVRSEYRSRFVVAEFKNYEKKTGQRQVESIEQYLWSKAFRSFGLLISRVGHDASAAKARRRAWVEHDKLIVLLCDADLIDMTQLWEEGQDPFQIVDAHLEDFFRGLCP